MANCDFAMMYLRRLCDGHMQDFVTTLWSALHDLTYFLIKKMEFLAAVLVDAKCIFSTNLCVVFAQSSPLVVS